jgi:uncharacterized protein
VSGNLYGIMMKYPQPGQVKTRLAAAIGDEKAAEICRQVITRMMERTMPAGSEYERRIFYSPASGKKAFEAWFPGETFIAQTGGDIGGRMDNVICGLLDLGADKAVITGSDIPDISRAIILQAFELLDDADVVLGPARDGGYYLIGMKGPMPGLFRNIPWSSEIVFSETVRLIMRSGKSYAVLPILSDLDTVEDLDLYPDLKIP